jgi:hypothetical protein
MKTMKKNILLLCVLFSTYSIYSQTAITSSGGTAIGEGGSATYSIGQLVYTTQIQNNVSIAQGVQQAYEFQEVLSNLEILTTNLTLLAYPNPTSDNFVLSISDNFQDNLTYILFDVQGKPCINGIIRDLTTQISIQNFANGIYFLRVANPNSSIKVFKIIKQ